MDLIVPTAMHPEREDQPLPYEWFVGIDWGSQQHQVCVLDRDRRRVGERAVDHDGASLGRLADWQWTLKCRVARLSKGCSNAASMSLRSIPSNSTGSGTVTVWRVLQMIGVMP